MDCRICSTEILSKKIMAREMMFGTRKLYPYYHCSKCGTLQIETPVTDPELLYPSNYYSFNYEKSSRWQNKIKMFLYKKAVSYYLGKSDMIGKVFSSLRPNAEVESIIKFMKPGNKILDIGCGTGIFIKTLASLGFNHPIGIDPFISESVFNERYSICKVGVSDYFSEENFDLIMLHHSFEHMSNPYEVLEKIRNLLSDSGSCIIRIPVSDCYAFEHYKENWVQIDAPRHLFLHTEKSISLLAEKCGLRLVEVIDDSTAFQIIGSEQYKMDIALIEPGTYFIPLHKKLIGKAKSIFDKKKIKEFQDLARKLKAEKRGDQKVFVLVKK